MKRHGNLWQQIITDENIQLAADKARKGKSKFPAVIHFNEHEEARLAELKTLLTNKQYRVSPYTTRTIFDPKERIIYILPFFPDRIVHHAVMNVVAPIWEAMLIPSTFACISGRGIHSGSQKTMEMVRRNTYCLKCDVSKFYPSVDHDILYGIIQRKIKCADTLWLLREIIYSFPGGKNIPIGNYTSQWLGNIYLNELDQFVKHELKIPDYVRYCDDFCLFHNSKTVLNDAAKAIINFVSDRLRMKLSKCDLFPVSQGVDFLGYRHFNNFKLLRKRTAKNMVKRLSKLQNLYDQGKITPEYCRSFLASAQGWMDWANTYNFQQRHSIPYLVEWAKQECKIVAQS